MLRAPKIDEVQNDFVFFFFRNDASRNSHFTTQSKPYAEYWFGTHPKAPSRVVGIDGKSRKLSDWLAARPKLLGALKDKNGNLPFLFKVLSQIKRYRFRHIRTNLLRENFMLEIRNTIEMIITSPRWQSR